jgi:hypothetical protein
VRPIGIGLFIAAIGAGLAALLFSLVLFLETGEQSAILAIGGWITALTLIIINHSACR